jgi:hypothetical protein
MIIHGIWLVHTLTAKVGIKIAHFCPNTFPDKALRLVSGLLIYNTAPKLFSQLAIIIKIIELSPFANINVTRLGTISEFGEIFYTKLYIGI